MKLSKKAMADIDRLIRDIDEGILTKETIINDLISIHGYLSIIQSEGDKDE